MLRKGNHAPTAKAGGLLIGSTGGGKERKHITRWVAQHKNLSTEQIQRSTSAEKLLGNVRERAGRGLSFSIQSLPK